MSGLMFSFLAIIAGDKGVMFYVHGLHGMPRHGMHACLLAMGGGDLGWNYLGLQERPLT